MDVKQLLNDLDARIADNPSSTLRSLARELRVSPWAIEQAVREAYDVTFNKYLQNKRLTLVLKTIEDRREPVDHQDLRVEPRTTIPGATVTYWLRGERILNASAPCPLFDLSREGMAFLSERPLGLGRRTSILLKCPGSSDDLHLEGHVVYSVCSQRAGYQYRIGVRFAPFEAREGCNAPGNLRILTELLETAISVKQA
jgi:AraC-like DNA-binding protein